MNRAASHRAAGHRARMGLVVTLAVSVVPSLRAQHVASQPSSQTAPRIRAVSAPIAVTKVLPYFPDEIREIPSRRVLVNSSDDRQLLLFDSTLSHSTVLADTLGSGASPYPRFGKLIPYVADSTLFIESDSRTFVLIDDQGKFGRVMAPPRPRDLNLMLGSASVGADLRGSIVYQGPRASGFQLPCRVDVPSLSTTAALQKATDSVAIVRANFETRAIDTIARYKTVNELAFPTTVTDGNCKILSATVVINPSIQSTDTWTVSARGSVAIVRGHDYHVDFIDADGTKRSGPKLPFDWRRVTDTDKQNRVDSAKKIIDSVSAAGGYRLKVCGTMRTFMIAPPDSTGSSGNMIQLGGGPPNAASSAVPVTCQTVAVTATFVPLKDMADYLAPIREDSAKPDLDGNVWILPTTSLSAKGGLLYDVIDENGVMIERVQLPADRDIAGFGRNGVLYLSHRMRGQVITIEKVKIVR